LIKNFITSSFKSAVDRKEIFILHNKNWQKGKSFSIKVALKEIPENCSGVMFLLGDMPYITNNMIQKAVNLFNEFKGRKIIYFGNKKNIGHPIIFPKKYFTELLNLKGDQGGKEVLMKNFSKAISAGRFMNKYQQDIDQIFLPF
jgi:molybdenum cofactor cytidylyltransferase